MRSITKIICYVTVFAIAMGFMESAVVIYLREIYYPSGFRFPLIPIPARLATVEILREAATVIMLICVGYLSGRSVLQRFAFFSVAFAVWDLCYYLFLYIFLGWPDSLFTWDILFLIPWPWVGPVWAPCLLCVLMLGGSIPIILRTELNTGYKILKSEWFIMITGAVVCILSFMFDYLQQTTNVIKDPVTSADLFSDIHSFIPQVFKHIIFFPGFILMMGAILHNLFITNKHHNHEK